MCSLYFLVIKLLLSCSVASLPDPIHTPISMQLVEKSPADLTVSSGEEMVKLVQKTRAVHEDLSEDSA